MLNKVIEILDEHIEQLKESLEEMRKEKISCNSFGAGFDSGALDKCKELREIFLEALHEEK